MKNVQHNLDGVVTTRFQRRNGDTNQPLLGLIDELKKKIVDFSEDREGQNLFLFLGSVEWANGLEHGQDIDKKNYEENVSYKCE